MSCLGSILSLEKVAMGATLLGWQELQFCFLIGSCHRDNFYVLCHLYLENKKN